FDIATVEFQVQIVSDKIHTRERERIVVVHTILFLFHFCMFHQPEIFMSFLQLDMVQHSVWFDQDLGRTISKTYGIMASMVIAFDDFGFGTWIYDNDIFGIIKFLLLTHDKMDQVDRLLTYNVS